MNFQNVKGCEAAGNTRRTTATGQDRMIDAGRRCMANINAAPITRLNRAGVGGLIGVEGTARTIALVLQAGENYWIVRGTLGDQVSAKGDVDPRTAQLHNRPRIDRQAGIRTSGQTQRLDRKCGRTGCGSIGKGRVGGIQTAHEEEIADGSVSRDRCSVQPTPGEAAAGCHGRQIAKPDLSGL